MTWLKNPYWLHLRLDGEPLLSLLCAGAPAAVADRQLQELHVAVVHPAPPAPAAQASLPAQAAAV